MRWMAVLLMAGCAFGQEPNRILFNRIGPYETALYIANADGSDERPLLGEPGGMDYNPAFSADGEWVVFTSERDGSAELYRVKADGTELERLTDDPAYDDQAAFSPDGSRIAFVSTRQSGRAKLWILDAATGAARPLAAESLEGEWGDFRPAWSPDGEWIAFSSDRETEFRAAEGRWEQLHLLDVYVIRADGTGLRRLTTASGACGSPKWSGDGTRLAVYCMPAEHSWYTRVFDPGGQTLLGEIDVAAGTVAQIPLPRFAPAVKMSPAFVGAGRVGFVSKSPRQAAILYSDGSVGPRGIVRSPSWTRDGSRVVFHRIHSIEAVNWRRTWSKEADFELILTKEMPAYHPSGERFVTTPLTTSNLEVVEAGSGEARVLYEDPGKRAMAGQWSPDGSEIMFGLGTFFVARARGAQLARVNADGTGFRELTSGANNNGFPSYSPDGKEVVYRTVGPQGQGLRVMNLEDGSVRALTEDYDNFPLWSPRGDRIVFTRRIEGDFELFTIRPDGSELQRVTFAAGNEAHCAWSPDGEWMIFSSSRTGFKDEAIYSDSPQPYGELFLMRYDGSELRQLTDNQWEDATPAWEPDGE